MFDEKAFIARVEAAGPEEFSEILRRPTAEQEKALRVHFGERRFERLHALALKSSVGRAVGWVNRFSSRIRESPDASSRLQAWVFRGPMFRRPAGLAAFPDRGRARPAKQRSLDIQRLHWAACRLKKQMYQG